MPRLSRTQEEMKNAEIVGTIAYMLVMTGRTKTDLSKYLCVSFPTYRKKELNPDEFTLGDLRRIAKFFNISLGRLLSENICLRE